MTKEKKPEKKAPSVNRATLTISSKNYSSWSLRGWLLCKIAGIPFEEEISSADDPNTRAELLLLSPSFLVPCLTYNGIRVWDTLAMAEYLAEIAPGCGLLPEDQKARTHCRSVSGEMHSGFANLRSALPMNLKSRHPGFKVWPGAAADIERVVEIWRECLDEYGGPYLFGELSMADAMYAPVCTRFETYDVKLDAVCTEYKELMLNLPFMKEWKKAALAEREELEELDVEF
ncbi:MAG: glutathione S-transferase family protein [Caulobacterales bacterium]